MLRPSISPFLETAIPRAFLFWQPNGILHAFWMTSCIGQRCSLVRHWDFNVIGSQSWLLLQFRDSIVLFPTRLADLFSSQVRHIIDFATIAHALATDLPSNVASEMVAFVQRELHTDNWLRALSLQDAAAPQSDRKDHGPYGSYDGWLGEVRWCLSDAVSCQYTKCQDRSSSVCVCVCQVQIPNAKCQMLKCTNQNDVLMRMSIPKCQDRSSPVCVCVCQVQIPNAKCQIANALCFNAKMHKPK